MILILKLNFDFLVDGTRAVPSALLADASITSCSRKTVLFSRGQVEGLSGVDCRCHASWRMPRGCCKHSQGSQWHHHHSHKLPPSSSARSSSTRSSPMRQRSPEGISWWWTCGGPISTYVNPGLTRTGTVVRCAAGGSRTSCSVGWICGDVESNVLAFVCMRIRG